MSVYEEKENVVSPELQNSELQARREARRKKILENSKLRLEMLYGRKNNEIETENKPLNNSHRTFSDPEMETEEMFTENIIPFPQSFLNKRVSNEREVFADQNLFQTNKNKYDELDQLLDQQNQKQNIAEEKQVSLLTKLINSKFHLIFLSISTYGFVVFGSTFFSNYSIFLPLLIWELTETIIIRPKENATQALLHIVLLMVGVPYNISQIVLKISNILNKIFKDVGVFVFSLVICHVLYIQYGQSFKNLEPNINNVEDYVEIKNI